MALTTEELQALRSLSRAPEGRALVAMLERMQSDADVKLRSASGDDLLRKQGRAQQLDELLKALKSADEVINRQDPSRRAPRDWTQA